MAAQNRYYRPFPDSDSEETESCGTDASYFTEYDTKLDELLDRLPNYRQFATQLQLQQAAGPPLSNASMQLNYQRRVDATNRVQYSDYDKVFEPLNPDAEPKKEGFQDAEESFTDYRLLENPSLVSQATVQADLKAKKDAEEKKEAKPVSQEALVKAIEKVLSAGEKPAEKKPAPKPTAPDTRPIEQQILKAVPKESKKQTNIILLNSRDRDRLLYPTPTFVRLKLPRVYRNITNFQILQVSLLTSFYYFRPDKANVSLTIQEQDRVVPDPKTGAMVPLKVTRTIRTGSYNISQLLTEISKWLNNVPLFFDFTGGFNDFSAAFQSTGDFGVNFNEAGEWFYDTMTDDFVANPTKDFIVSRFWKNRFASQTSFTISEVRVAYYYPPLREAVLDPDYVGQVNLTAGLGIDPTITTTHEVSDRIVYTFQGIDDPVITAVINGNQAFLDSYRKQHTFVYYLANKYNVTVEAQSQVVVFTAPSLNTSLVNLLNLKQAQFLAEQLFLAGLTSAQYATITANNDRLRAVIQSMNQYQQTNFAKYFAIPFGSLSVDYFTHFDWTLLLRNGNDVTNIATSYDDPDYNFVSTIVNSNNIIAPLQQEPQHLWPNMEGLFWPINKFRPYSDKNHPYSVYQEQFRLQDYVISPSTYQLQPSLRQHDVNAVINISSSRYTLFEFLSPVRQTLQVETLPRPTKYRLPAYNQANYNSTIQRFFDASYAFVDSPWEPITSSYTFRIDNIPESNLTKIPQWQSTNVSCNAGSLWSYGRDYTSSLSFVSTPAQLSINTPYKAQFYVIGTPDNTGYDRTTSTLQYQLNLKTLIFDGSGNSAPPKQNMRLLVYHDRGAFMADAGQVRNESAYRFIQSTLVTPTMSTLDLALTVYPKQQYYFTFRPDDISFGTVFTKIFPYFSTGFTENYLNNTLANVNPSVDNPFVGSTLSNFNYAQVYDSNFLGLPIQSTLWYPDPTDDPSQQVLLTSNVPIGYDTNGVSDDFTDYMPFQVNTRFNFVPTQIEVGIDPVNQFQFQCNSPYSTDAASWFYSTGSNSVLRPRLFDVYSTQTVDHRQTKICHYYSQNYILAGWRANQYAPYLSNNDQQKPYSKTTTNGQYIRGYEYSLNPVPEPTPVEYLTLGQGACGWSFIPGDGSWSVDSIAFRSAFIDSNNDPNRAVTYWGVYNCTDINELQVQQVNLRSSICILSTTQITTYNPADPTTLSGGFDGKGGTYYQANLITSIPTNNRNSTITGYTQRAGTMTNDPANLYSVIAFDRNEYPIGIQAISGSAIPYPMYNEPKVQSAYLDGTLPPGSNFYDLVVPNGTTQDNWPVPFGAPSSFGPPPTTDSTQSQYLLSQPIGTIATHYIEEKPTVLDVSGIYQYDVPFYAPRLVADVKDFLLTQNGNFQVWYYPPTDRTTTLAWSLTPDLIYPQNENTSILGVAGNSSEFIFLGAQNFTTSNFRLRFKRFNPVSGFLDEYFFPSTFTIDNQFRLNTFSFTNMYSFVLAGQILNYPRLYQCKDMSTIQTYTFLASNTNIYHSQDASSNEFYWLRQDSNYGGSTFYQVDATHPFPGRAWTIGSNSLSALPSTFRTIAVSPFRGKPYENIIENILFTTAQTNSNFNSYYYSVYSLDSNTNKATVLKSVVPFSNVDVSGAPLQVADYVVSGYNSSRWFMCETFPYVWANRNNETDRKARVQSAWQIFYPWQKICLKKLANNINPIVDLTTLDYPEYPHTNMFYYSNYSNMVNDIGIYWGLEQSTNFTVASVGFQGFYFNSYIFDVPLRASSNCYDFQYIAVRNYSPCETSQVMVRFSLQNEYTFGYATFTDLFTEIGLISTGTASTLFNPAYSNTLSNFNTAFSTTQYWGSNLVPTFPGCNMTFCNYPQFATQYSTMYNQYLSTTAIINKIQSTVRGNVNQYIATKMSNILPPSALTRQQFTDPLQFRILWLSALVAPQLQFIDNWGLGYNLGFSKLDTPYGTVIRAQSFYKIIDDYIYLQMSPEYDINRLDFGGIEDSRVTQDTTGAIKTYYGKLLLNNFNTISQTLVHNPVTLTPALGKLDSLTFSWMEFGGAVIANSNCDWNISIQIQEEVSQAGSLVPATTGF